MLTLQLDSVSKDRDKYFGVYAAVKTKVLKYDFNPEKMPVLIDFIRASRDSVTSGLSAVSTSYKDSLSILKKENFQMKSTLDSLTNADASKAKLIVELKQLKKLLDSKIITQIEFDSKKKVLMDKWN